jgi:hypothetical protein
VAQIGFRRAVRQDRRIGPAAGKRKQAIGMRLAATSLCAGRESGGRDSKDGGEIHRRRCLRDCGTVAVGLSVRAGLVICDRHRDIIDPISPSTPANKPQRAGTVILPVDR